MKLSRAAVLERTNFELENIGCDLRIVDYYVSGAVLSNGFILNRNQWKSLIKRIHGSVESKNSIDQLFSVDADERAVTETRLRRIAAQKGAQSNLAKNFDAVVTQATRNCKLAMLDGTAGFQKGHDPWNKGLTKETSEILCKIATNREGEKNWQFNVPKSDTIKQHLSFVMREKIAQGIFIPNIMNSLSRKAISFNGQKYRSSWEALFAARYPNFEYEKLRIPYEDIDGKIRSYLVDFVHHDTKHVCEIKPASLQNTPRNYAKYTALRKWSDENNYYFWDVSERRIAQIIYHLGFANTVFDSFPKTTLEQLRRLYETYQTDFDRQTRYNL